MQLSQLTTVLQKFLMIADLVLSLSTKLVQKKSVLQVVDSVVEIAAVAAVETVAAETAADSNAGNSQTLKIKSYKQTAVCSEMGTRPFFIIMVVTLF
jgi:hypothetical protein